LARMHARARLLAGGDRERWAAGPDAEELRALQDESWIVFPRAVPDFHGADDEVSLPVDLKNTPELLVRMFELDLPDYVARTGRQPGVEIDLDGLVPHHERRLEFAQPPMVRHRETIALPELAGAGAWVVEFVAGRVSARALVRKGSLTSYAERTATGQRVAVFDGDHAAVAGAVVDLGGETFETDADGRVEIPNLPNRPATRGTVRAGKLAAPLELGSRTDRLALDARFLLDREQLLAGETARVQWRPRLTNHGHELPLERVENAALVVRAALLGDVTTERVIDTDLKLAATMETTFAVPADLLSLTLTLRGTVVPATGGDPVQLEAEQAYDLNAALETARIGGAFFSATADGHLLVLRGRNGEPLASRTVTLALSRDDYAVEVKTVVRTDENGEVALGALEGIRKVVATGTDIPRASYAPGFRTLWMPARLHVAAGEEIRLPLETPAPNGPDRRRMSLLELVENQPARNFFGRLRVEDDQLVIRELPAGDFRLLQGGHTTEILVSGGVESGGLLVSAARILPSHRPAVPAFEAAAAGGGELSLKIRNHGPDTRVTLIGSRYRHSDWPAGRAAHPFPRPAGNILKPAFQGNGFLAGGLLSDEMRYILDRRAARTFPGAMLPRPGLLLHRWTADELAQEVARGDDERRGTPAPSRTGEGSRMDGDYGDLPPLPGDASSQAATMDFLGFKSAVRFDLPLDEDGTLRVPLAEFEGSQVITMIVADGNGGDSLVLPLPASATAVRERRIARPLDPDSHHVATRRAAALAEGAEATIENLLDADWRAFTTLAEAHQFLYGMTGDERLRDFQFLGEWPEFSEERKLELLEQHHCHELHLFLSRRDAEFFEKHVKPLLEEKPEPQFIDELLLGRDLSAYLRPFAYRKLNAAEKALLAAALPDARAGIAADLALRWELAAPSPEEETVLFTQTLRGGELAVADSLGLASGRGGSSELWGAGDMQAAQGVQYLSEKLRRIIIPKIDFEDTTVEEAIDFLRMRAAELDTLELDPARRGVNFVIRRPRGGAADGALIGGDPGAIRIPELRVRNVPLAVALRYITEATRLRYRVDDFAVTLVPQTEVGEDLFTRTFRLPPGFAESLRTPVAGEDPFADAGTAPRLSARTPMIELLRQAGITFKEGSAASVAGNSLLVTNTPTEIDKIEQLIELELGSPAFPRTPATPADVDPFADARADVDPFAMPPPPPPAKLFPDSTRLWRESNYYRLAATDKPDLAPLNQFWVDLAASGGERPFLSPHFNACHRNANEALLCLALLDLPFKAERPDVTADGSTLRVRAREPMLLFYKDTRRTEQVAPESPLLVRQSFHPLAEPFRTENGRKVENPVTGDFQRGVPYGTSLVVTNPTGIGRRIEVLAQIPAGAIPLAGMPATLSSAHDLDPHGVLTWNLAFYFPEAGEFPVYPLHVSEDGTVLAHSDSRILRVGESAAPPDASSWEVVARDGTAEEVLARLRSDNLHALRLEAILWRLKDPAFFREVVAILGERMHFSAPVASYAVLHNDAPTLRDLLENHPIAGQLGDWFDSPLLDVRPRVHADWETLEFDPLVNPRSHDFAGNHRFTHEAAREHYLAYLRQLGWKPALDADDRLTLCAFLFLQDRTEEALERFDAIDPEALRSRLRYDYLHAVALFHRGNAADARAIAEARLPGLPPGLWRDRFAEVITQAVEIAALAQPIEQQEPDAPAPADPSMELAAGPGGRLALRHHGLESASLRLFSVDLEVLFSKDPFLEGDGSRGGIPAIRANDIRRVDLAADASETLVELPEAFRRGNVLVAAEAPGRQLLKIVDSQAFELRHTPADRSVQVLEAGSLRPLVKTYVKVYAETYDGEVVFHKDGYTDLRGKFDYLSHTGIPVDRVKRVALFISHPEAGSRTVTYAR